MFAQTVINVRAGAQTINKKIMTIKEAMKDLKYPQYFGEDGEMGVASKTRHGAFLKFRKQIRQDVGDEEAQEILEEDIRPAWLYLADQETKEQLEDQECDYFLSLDKKKCGENQVWFLSPN